MATTGQFDLAGAHALIIGGSSGIGLAIAGAFRDAGATVAIAGRRRDKLDEAASLLGLDPARDAIALDARDVAAIAALSAELEAEARAPDILVNCQGVTAIKPALDLSEAEYDAIVDTNTKSVFFACQAFGRGMVARGRGAIINIASLAAHTGWAQAAAYAVSKWGVVGLTQSLAAEWGGGGVRVNAIAPGFFLTELNREKMSPERKAEATRRAAMGRMGEVSELTGAAVFLASDASRFVTGETLRVDGGYLASGI